MFYRVMANHPSDLDYCWIRTDPERMEPEPEEEYTWAEAFMDVYGAVLYGAGCVLAGMILGWMMIGGV